jgi:ATP-dependent Lon protease
VAEFTEDNIEEEFDKNVLVIKVPPEVPVLPLTGTVIFPMNVAHLHVKKGPRLKLINSLSEDKENEQVIALLTPKDPNDKNPSPDNLNRVGVLARVINKLSYSKDTVRIIVQGLTRIRVKKYKTTDPFITAQIERVEIEETNDLKTSTLLDNILEIFTNYVSENPRVSNELVELIEDNFEEGPSAISDLISSLIPFELDNKQKLLELSDVYDRLKYQYPLLNKIYHSLNVEKDILEKTSSSLESGQREYFLRKQIEEIKKQLGEGQSNPDVLELQEKLKETHLPPAINKIVSKNMDKLSKMHSESSDYSVMLNYLECLIELPWEVSTVDNLSIPKVQAALDRDHSGLKKAKERIVEFLAVMKLKKDLKGPILCFVGPPGTGKTSVAISIANALGRKFIRLPMGGVRDEAEIRGHRRTYVGAMPGRIVQGIKNNGCNNPLFIIDEIDKISSDGHGDPASALLEVLDPEQNANFRDNFLGVEFDLSKVLFIATANDIDNIPSALLDRMELIDFDGYSMLEKTEIAIKHLIPTQIKKHGLKVKNVSIPKNTLHDIIRRYTREAGVRHLNRLIAAVCRKIAKKVATGKNIKYSVKSNDLKRYLGPLVIPEDLAQKVPEVGVVTGLAWTPVGGEILILEVNKTIGKGDIKITGQLGNVMQESVQAAITTVKASSKSLGVKLEDFNEFDLHFHFPDLGTPKDGPSAGVTVATALASVMSNKKVRSDIAMTGEISLRGNVLPVGGVREKVMAAYRIGIKTVILPKDNKPDLDDLPPEVKKGLKFVLASKLSRVFKEALCD